MAYTLPTVKALLDRYGLGSLAEWATGVIIDDMSEDEFQNLLYDRPEFKAAFPEIEGRQQRAKQLGISMTPISPEDVIAYRSGYRQLLRSYSVPPNLWDSNADIAEQIIGDKSLDEINAGLELVSKRVHLAAPEVRSMFDELTGNNGDTALFLMFLNPTQAPAALEEMVEQAEIGGAARRFGFNPTRDRIEQLALYNIDYGQATEGFAQLDEVRGLFDESLFENVDYSAEEEGASAVFGIGGGAAEKLKQRAETRTAQTAGGSGGLQEERGATSLGGAGRR